MSMISQPSGDTFLNLSSEKFHLSPLYFIFLFILGWKTWVEHTLKITLLKLFLDLFNGFLVPTSNVKKYTSKIVFAHWKKATCHQWRPFIIYYTSSWPKHIHLVSLALQLDFRKARFWQVELIMSETDTVIQGLWCWFQKQKKFRTPVRLRYYRHPKYSL